MSSRGVFIGQIIDDLDAISHQVKRRCELGQTDLNSVLENFFLEILNLTLDAALVNLNKKRSNEPGLDLGDSTSKRKIAFQITSRSDPAKVKDTLTKIKKAQLAAYQEFFILVIGERRKSYTIDPALSAKCHGFAEANIIGITDLCRMVMETKIDTIRAIQQKLQQERREIRIELEPEIEGTFETDTADLVERRPSITRSDGTLFYASDATGGLFESAAEAAEALDGFIDRLAPLPRLSRGMLGWIMDESEHRYGFSEKHEINADLVQRKYPDTQDLLVDTRLLKSWGFLGYEDQQDGESPTFWFRFPGTDHSYFADAFMNFVKEQDLKVSSLFQTMNFSPFGPPPAADAPAPVPVKPAVRRRVRLSGAQKAQRSR